MQLCAALLAVQCRAMYICHDKCRPVADKCQAMSTKPERQKCMDTVLKECYEACEVCKQSCIGEHEACTRTRDECIQAHHDCNDECAMPRPPPEEL